MGPEVRSGDSEAPALAVAPAALDELAHRRNIREGAGPVAYLYRAVDKFGNTIDSTSRRRAIRRRPSASSARR